jgi:hypothetical protein
LEQSSSYLYEDAAADLLDSKPGSVKQVLNNVWMNVRNQDFSSTQLEFEEISNCHVNMQVSTVKIQHELSTILLQQIFTMPTNDG